MGYATESGREGWEDKRGQLFDEEVHVVYKLDV
jgi:hypothetical protein